MNLPLAPPKKHNCTNTNSPSYHSYHMHNYTYIIFSLNLIRNSTHLKLYFIFVICRMVILSLLFAGWWFYIFVICRMVTLNDNDRLCQSLTAQYTNWFPESNYRYEDLSETKMISDMKISQMKNIKLQWWWGHACSENGWPELKVEFDISLSLVHLHCLGLACFTFGPFTLFRIGMLYAHNEWILPNFLGLS